MILSGIEIKRICKNDSILNRLIRFNIFIKTRQGETEVADGFGHFGHQHQCNPPFRV